MLLRSIRRRAALCGVTTAVLVGLATAGVTAPAAATPDVFRPQLVTVDTPSRADKQLLQTLGLDLTEHAGHDYVEVVLHTPARRRRPRARPGWATTSASPTCWRREAENNAVNAAYAAATVSSPLPSGRDSYRTLDDYNADMAALAAEHPDMVEAVHAAAPVARRPDRLRHRDRPRRRRRPRTAAGVRCCSACTTPASGPPASSRWSSPSTWSTRYGTDRRITGLLDRPRVVVVPVVNVDGFDLSRTDGELVDLRDGSTAAARSRQPRATPGNAYKRKNCRVVDGQDTPDGTVRGRRHQPRRLRASASTSTATTAASGAAPAPPTMLRRPDLPRRRRRSRSRRRRTSVS